MPRAVSVLQTTSENSAMITVSFKVFLFFCYHYIIKKRFNYFVSILLS